MSVEPKPEPVVLRCECNLQDHPGPCKNDPADHGIVKTSPALCMRCLFGCAE